MSQAALPVEPDLLIRTAPRTRGYSTAWWGMVVLITTESMVFLALLAAYFFVRAGASRWPLGGISPPELHHRLREQACRSLVRHEGSGADLDVQDEG